MALNPKGILGSPEPTHRDCLACGLLATIGMDGLVGEHGNVACKATGERYKLLRGIARQAGSWAVRWREAGGEWQERPCGEREAARLANDLGGIAVSPAVIDYLNGAGK